MENNNSAGNIIQQLTVSHGGFFFVYWCQHAHLADLLRIIIQVLFCFDLCVNSIQLSFLLNDTAGILSKYCLQ